MSVLRQPRLWATGLVATGLVPLFVFAITAAQTRGPGMRWTPF
jgi:hypothetical protein